MRLTFSLMGLLLAIFVAGCAPQQPYVAAPTIGNAPPTPNAPQTHDQFTDAHSAAVRPLPYKGRLVEGDPTELPPAVAMALAKDAPLTFSYREELTHDEYHIPMILSAFDPVTYLGAPLGDYGVTAFATLTIFQGNKVVADYTAKVRVSKSFNVYSEPKHSELDRAAREAVRNRIDQKLYDDADRVTRGATSSAAPVTE
jgi:hypothetical protein